MATGGNQNSSPRSNSTPNPKQLDGGPGAAPRRPASHAPGVIPGVPVRLTVAQVDTLWAGLETLGAKCGNVVWYRHRSVSVLKRLGLVDHGLASDIYRTNENGRAALAAHVAPVTRRERRMRAAIDIRASFTIDTAGAP